MSKLKEILKYVSEHNDFYKNIIRNYNITDPTDITQYPILTRKQLQENRYNMFSDGYKAKYYSNTLRRQYSSGTTGIPINVYWDHDDYRRSILPLWKQRYINNNITPLSRKAMFTLLVFDTIKDKNKTQYFKQNNNILIFNRSSLQRDENYLELIKHLENFMPDWLYVQPSILNRLIQCYEKYKIKPPKSIKYIESVGEILLPSFQMKAKMFFNVPVINMYGSEEHNAIAIECPHGRMHILNENIKVEIQNNNQIKEYGEGESIITNLNNSAMPLVRYNQGDRIVINELTAPCKCNNSAPVVSIVKGRITKTIKDGNYEINEFFLLELISEIQNEFSDPLKKYHFVFQKNERIVILYVEFHIDNYKWKKKIIDSLEKLFYSKIDFETTLNLKISEDRQFFENENSKFEILSIK